jgi:hypothetical protein
MAKKAASLDPVIVRQILLESTSTLDFLKKYFQLRVEILGKPGYSTFSQRAGFSSRSHIRDILNGRVKITSASMIKISKALGFKNEVADLFFLKDKMDVLDGAAQGNESHSQILQFLKQKIESESVTGSGGERQLPYVYRAQASLDKRRYEEFKTALTELLNNFVSNVNASENDGVVEVVCEMSLIETQPSTADSSAL